MITFSTKLMLCTWTRMITLKFDTQQQIHISVAALYYTYTWTTIDCTLLRYACAIKHSWLDQWIRKTNRIKQVPAKIQIQLCLLLAFHADWNQITILRVTVSAMYFHHYQKPVMPTTSTFITDKKPQVEIFYAHKTPSQSQITLRIDPLSERTCSKIMPVM